VQSVPAPHLVGRRAPLLALLLALAVAVAAISLATRIDTSPAPAPTPAAASGSGLIGGVQLQSARCAQWNAGTAAERSNVLGALTYSVGGATPYGNGTTLGAAQANALFDRACSSPIAQNWLLYELYIRAAGFRSYATP
jgi:hypothetical protein